MHERESANTYVTTVGVEVNDLLERVAAKPERRWKLRATLCWLSQRPYVTGRQLERGIGHSVCVLMLRRPLLSIFRTVYALIQQHYDTPRRLWKSAAKECAAASALIPFAYADLRRDCSRTATCFDASETGLGVVEKVSPAERAEANSRHDDRWRFRWGWFATAAPRHNSAWQLGWGETKSVKPVEN